jgi:hypothetical protein
MGEISKLPRALEQETGIALLQLPCPLEMRFSTFPFYLQQKYNNIVLIKVVLLGIIDSPPETGGWRQPSALKKRSQLISLPGGGLE